jgi:serine protease AprX
VIVGALVAAALALPASAAPRSAPADAAPQSVVVQASSVRAAAAAVRRAGGTVVRELPIVDGVAARVPAGAVLTGVDEVTPDLAVTPKAVAGDSGTTPPESVYTQETQAAGMGTPKRAVTVAVIDTGISPVPGIADNLLTVPDPMRTGEAAECANFSSESTCDDSYGHGTFLAGLIAGDGAYQGMDPDARLVSVKIAGRSGSADTSQLLAAIQYVVSFKDQLGIKVLNLSLGTNSNHDSRKDPLNRAVERAWASGITVVVAASNRGHESAGTISKPADDPLVVTVGAVDDRGTGNRSDDTVPAFTARGPVRQGTGSDTFTVLKPDVVAPGVGLISLTSPGSHIEQTAPPSTVGVPGYRRGSGTSQAAAVVSGAVALLLERRDWTPDEVKAALVRGAYAVAGQPADVVGAGIVSVSGALGQTVSGSVQPMPRQDSFDDLDRARAATLVTSFTCGPARTVLDGEDCVYVHGRLTALARDAVQGPDLVPFDAVGYASGTWNGQSWYGSQWMSGQSWYGQSWYGQSWYGQSWYEADNSPPPSEGSRTDFGTVLPGSAWYGVWR